MTAPPAAGPPVAGGEARADVPPGFVRWLVRATWLLLAAALVSAVVVGADRPADPHLMDRTVLTGSDGHSVPSRLPGVAQVGFRVIRAAKGGAGRHGCGLVDPSGAAVPALRGLLGLAGYDAVIVRPGDGSVAPLANPGLDTDLAIAWFDTAGVYLGRGTLPVCQRVCAALAPPAAFATAIETVPGGLEQLGAGAGSAVVVGGAC